MLPWCISNVTRCSHGGGGLGGRLSTWSRSPPLPWHSPLQLLQGHCDPQAVAQDVKSRQDICPLHHLPQRPALQHPGAEHVSRLLCQEANVDKDLWGGTQGSARRSTQPSALSPATPGRPGQQQTLSPSWAWADAFWHRGGTKSPSDRTRDWTRQSHPVLMALTFQMEEETTVNTDNREFHEMRGTLKETDR